MCGIAGYVGYGKEGMWQATHRVLTELLLESEQRGEDATGFAALQYGALSTGHVLATKAPAKASEFVERPDWRRLKQRRCCAVLTHVRAATHGSPERNENNHPFTGRIGRRDFSLVHNGIITNASEIADRYSLKLQTQCDSEVALRLIEQSRSYAMGLYQCTQQLRGSMALALLDHSTGSIWCIRDGYRPLWVCKLDDGRLFFASTAEILGQALAKAGVNPSEHAAAFLPIAAHHVHVLAPNGQMIAPYWSKIDLARIEAWR